MICKMANGYDAVSLTIDSYLSHNAENDLENREENREEDNSGENSTENKGENVGKNEKNNEIFSAKRSAAYERWLAVPHTPYVKVRKL
jgi:hypothetical protein